MRENKRRWKLAALASALAAIGIGGALVLDHKPASTVANIGPPPTLSPLAAGNDVVPPTTTIASAPTPAPPVFKGPPPAPDAVFAALAAEGAPYSDHLKAMRMAWNCLRENNPHGVRVPIAPKGMPGFGPCELRADTYTDAATRKRLVIECAKAGDCWNEMVNEGPDGFNPVFNKAEFAALELEARAAALKKGDPGAATFESRRLRREAEQQTGDEQRATFVRALTLDIARSMTFAVLTPGMPYDSKTDPSLKKDLAYYEAKGITQTEANAATKEAKRLAKVYAETKAKELQSWS